jgi:hypothetical protein
MQSTLTLHPARSTSWSARILQTLVVLFMLFDVAGKYMLPEPVVSAFARQGMVVGLAPVIGTLLLVLAVLYVVPRTSVLGAVLLTGYLGGACAVNMRAGFTPFETIFPVLFGILMWVPVYMLEPRARLLLPFVRRL